MEKKPEYKDWIEAKILQKTVVVDEAGNYLILTRSTEGFGSRKGKDDLSGGSMDKKDFEGGIQNAHEVAITREVKEETGLEATNFKVIHVSSGTKMIQSSGEILVLALGYICRVTGVKPDVKLDGKEHTSYRWVSRDEALNADFGEDGGFHKAILQEVKGF